MRHWTRSALRPRTDTQRLTHGHQGPHRRWTALYTQSSTNCNSWASRSTQSWEIPSTWARVGCISDQLRNIMATESHHDSWALGFQQHRQLTVTTNTKMACFRRARSVPHILWQSRHLHQKMTRNTLQRSLVSEAALRHNLCLRIRDRAGWVRSCRGTRR